MEDFNPASDPQELTHRAIAVQVGYNIIETRLRRHTWTKVLSEGRDVECEDSPNEQVRFWLTPGNYTIVTDGELVDIEAKPNEIGQEVLSFLTLSSDAPDQHVVDGVGEIPGDGTSYCNILINHKSTEGEVVVGSKTPIEVFVRTTGGTIMDDCGRKRIRGLTLEAGRGTFRLVSESQPKLVTISVVCQVPLVVAGELRIEFV